jgi:D-sorbitol dehydrogenase (acceptor)
MKLSGKIAIVTGGARGIGRAIADRYAREGARVIVADVLLDEAQATAGEIGHEAIALPLDVRSQRSIDDMVAAAVAQFGGIDILVNNAAVLDAGPLLDATPEMFDRIFGVNVKGLFFTLQAVARQMIEQGRGGKIINMSSQAGRRGEPGAPLYSASKAAVISLTQSTALLLIKHKINVNAIAPGPVDTGMNRAFAERHAQATGDTVENVLAAIASGVPAGRIGVPEDFGGPAVLLASSEADFVVAQTWNVDGGNWMS